jgi:asparaginyl-tRNA synthetase
MAAAMAPATPLCLKPYAALRYLSLYTKPNPYPNLLRYSPRGLAKPLIFPPFFHRPVPFSGSALAVNRRRLCCTIVAGALQSGEAAEKTKPEFANKPRGEMGEKIGEFRKKLKIADIKGEPDEGLGRVGQTLVVMGWVRTLRVQSSITFIEVTLIVSIVSLLLGWFIYDGAVWFPRKCRNRNGTRNLNFGSK